MPEIVSAVIQPKGRIVNQFMQYFAPALFPDYRELFPEIIKALEADRKRLKNGQLPSSKETVIEMLYDEYVAKFPELRQILGVAPDFRRENQPYRIVFNSLEGSVNGIDFRLYGDLNPIETLRDTNVNFAIASSDLLLAKFVSLLPRNLNVADPSIILANLPYDTTTIEYTFPLRISQSRHMLIMNFKPDSFKVDYSGLPILEDGTTIAVNGEYYLIYKYMFNGRYNLLEGEKVEPAVLRKDGKRKFGLEIVSSGNTLLEEAANNGSELWVFAEPIYETSAIVLINDGRIEGRRQYRSVVELIQQINQQMQEPLATTRAYMERNLAHHLIR